MTENLNAQQTITPKILVVDDTPINARLLMEVFKDDEYEILVADRGEAALKLVAEEAPDLILLDVMMPVMDGYEVCQRLKSSPEWRDIPVIIITALNETQDYVEAISSGADDFMSKPFNQVVLRARVKAYIKTRRLTAEVKRQGQFRYELLRMVARDLSNHIGAVLGSIELLMSMDELSERASRRASKAMQSVEEAARLLHNFMGIENMDAGTSALNPSCVDLAAVCRRLVELREVVLQRRELEIQTDVPDHLMCETDSDLLERVIQNIVDNAIKYARSDSLIDVTGSEDGSDLVLSVSNCSELIPADELERMFDRFYQVQIRPENSRGGSGLGLSFCRMAVDRIGGSISAVSPVPGRNDGVCVTMRLPRSSKTSSDMLDSKKQENQAQTYERYLAAPSESR